MLSQEAYTDASLANVQPFSTAMVSMGTNMTSKGFSVIPS